jgi:hypothetical protein
MISAEKVGFDLALRCGPDDFLERWVTDQKDELGLPNHPDFIDYRHDQSIFTLLIYKYALQHLDYSTEELDKILKPKLNSSLARHVMARIDDAERMERGQMIRALLLSFMKYKRIKRMNN